jgi:hypothetical protein
MEERAAILREGNDTSDVYGDGAVGGGAVWRQRDAAGIRGWVKISSVKKNTEQESSIMQNTNVAYVSAVIF